MRSSSHPQSWKAFGFGVLLVGVLGIAALGTVQVAGWALERLMVEAAESSALAWARAVERGLPADAPEEALFNGAQARDAAQTLAEIRGFQVFDRAGRAHLAEPARPQPGGVLTLPVLTAQRAIEAGRPVVLPGEQIAAPRVLVPVAAAGRAIAVAELQLDQSELRQRTETTLWLAAAALMALSAFGFGVPLFAFLSRNRHALEADAEAAFFAGHEPMTGLLNRVRFVEALEEHLVAHRREEASLALLLVDLDGLKEINDALGHDLGDEVIVQVARALRSAAGDAAVVARLGGDEFAVVAPRLGGRPEAESLAGRMLAAIAAPRTLRGHEVAVSARIGVSLMPTDGDTVLRLMKAADLALDQARRAKDGAVVFFERAIESELQRRRELEHQIRETLAGDAFDLHYQPVLDAQNQRLLGFEALLRMPAGAGGFVSPAVFVPIAEEIGLITQIGDWVLRRACAVASGWPEPLTIAVNLSPAQFKEGGVSRAVAEALRLSGLAPERLQLEITEGLLLSDDAEIMRELGDLKGLGVSIVMDDFGTGYSSLSYLWKFPFDKIKIDRSFMRAFETDHRGVANILQAIMSLSRALRMRVTAEGVETPAQAAFLKDLGCDEVQGFYFARPMPLIDVAAYVLKDAERSVVPAAPEQGSLRLIAG